MSTVKRKRLQRLPKSPLKDTTKGMYMSAKRYAMRKADKSKLTDEPQQLLLYTIVLTLILSFAAFFIKGNSDFLIAAFSLLGKVISYYFSTKD